MPFVRGEPVSRKPENVLKEVRHLTKKDVKEIILTGINLGLYGKEFQDYNLIELINDLSNNTAIELIRVSSLEPMFFDPRARGNEFVTRLQNNPKICPHFHISMQNGSDKVLKAMKRAYTIREFEEMIRSLKTAFPDSAVGCDVIVGFPGETEKDFEQTFSFIKSLDVAYLHVFRFSQRPGTEAEKLKNRVPEKAKKRRMQKLIALGERKKKEYINFLIDEKIPLRAVLETKKNNLWKSVSDHYIKVFVPDEKFKNGQMKLLIPKKYIPEKDGILTDLAKND